MSKPDDYRPPAEATLRCVERELGGGARVVRRQRLIGGRAADMDRLTVDAGAFPFEVVLRRWAIR